MLGARGRRVVVRVANEDQVLAVVPLLEDERPAADRVLAVGRHPPGQRLGRHDSEVALRECVEQRLVGGVELQLERRRVQGPAGLVVRADVGLDCRVAGGRVQPVVEVVDHRLGVERRAVGELHARLEVKRPRELVLGDRPAGGQPGDDPPRAHLRDQRVEDLAVDVGLLHPAADQARRLLLVPVVDRPAVDGLCIGGVRARRRGGAGRRGSTASACRQAGGQRRRAGQSRHQSCQPPAGAGDGAGLSVLRVRCHEASKMGG